MDRTGSAYMEYDADKYKQNRRASRSRSDDGGAGGRAEPAAHRNKILTIFAPSTFSRSLGQLRQSSSVWSALPPRPPADLDARAHSSVPWTLVPVIALEYFHAEPSAVRALAILDMAPPEHPFDATTFNSFAGTALRQRDWAPAAAYWGPTPRRAHPSIGAFRRRRQGRHTQV